MGPQVVSGSKLPLVVNYPGTGHTWQQPYA